MGISGSITRLAAARKKSGTIGLRVAREGRVLPCAARQEHPVRAGQGRGGTPDRMLLFPLLSKEAIRFALAMGEVVQRTGRLFSLLSNSRWGERHSSAILV